MLGLARLQTSFVLHKLFMIGLSNGSKQNDKSARHSKLIRNVAGRIFPRSAHKNPLQLLRLPRVVAPPKTIEITPRYTRF